MKGALAAALSVAAIAGCGDPHRDELERNRRFVCNDRTGSYVVVGSIVAAELGVMMDCRDQGPRIVRWTVDRAGNRDEHQASISVGEFEDIWAKFEGAGWKYLKDCEGTEQAGDPMYTFDFNDWNGPNTFTCTISGDVPFPYHIFVDELDLSASHHAPKDPAGNRRGPDDP